MSEHDPKHDGLEKFRSYRPEVDEIRLVRRDYEKAMYEYEMRIIALVAERDAALLRGIVACQMHLALEVYKMDAHNVTQLNILTAINNLDKAAILAGLNTEETSK